MWRVFIIFCAIVIQAMFVAKNTIASNEQNILTLQTATKLAIQKNPDLAQVRARAEALAAVPSQLGTLPDPEISIRAMNLPVNTFNTNQEPMTQIGPAISQQIPFPGKLSLRAEAASFEAGAAFENVIEARSWLLRHVKHRWWQIFYLDHALEIVENNQLLLRQFIQVARTKYEVGKGLQQDILLAQLELSGLLDQQLILKNTRQNTVAQLNALLGKAANKPIRLPKKIDETLPALRTEQTLYEQAESYRAILAAKRKSIDAAQARLDLAKKDYYPDFNVGAFYGFRRDQQNGIDRSDFLSLNLSMHVPIFLHRKQAKAVDQRNSELMQQKYALEDEWNNVRKQISQSYHDYQRAREQMILFKTGIIPQARQTVASMLAGYQVSQVDFLNLVRSQISLLSHELKYWNAFTEANQALAQLTAVVGKEDIYE
ncbi:TolC family protein [Nitrosomonas sp.]|uniref:TolC family protein n=1 Tax=Nitrosomonas sp. TaxID=42353 RepID=UPI002851FA57|nr:TolC family protein [Nitrosomonas sp.]MDR4514667.1 TolC family protein [Nitrosomonas sp.]